MQQAGGADRYEGVLEVTARLGVTLWLPVQPPVQHVSSLSADPRIDAATVLSLRLQMGLRRHWRP